MKKTLDGSVLDIDSAEKPPVYFLAFITGADAWAVVQWLKSEAGERGAAGEQAQLLTRVIGEQFELVEGAPAPQEKLASDRVQNPHDPEATYATKGQGQQKKEHVGYKVQVAETVSEAVPEGGSRPRPFKSRSSNGRRCVPPEGVTPNVAAWRNKPAAKWCFDSSGEWSVLIVRGAKKMPGRERRCFIYPYCV